MIKPFRTNDPKPRRPDWLQVGAYVKTGGWVGQVIEITESPRAIYVRIFGAKHVLYSQAGGDLVEFNERQVAPVTREQAMANYADYMNRANELAEQIGAMMAPEAVHG